MMKKYSVTLSGNDDYYYDTDNAKSAIEKWFNLTQSYPNRVNITARTNDDLFALLVWAKSNIYYVRMLHDRRECSVPWEYITKQLDRGIALNVGKVCEDRHIPVKPFTERK